MAGGVRTENMLESDSGQVWILQQEEEDLDGDDWEDEDDDWDDDEDDEDWDEDEDEGWGDEWEEETDEPRRRSDHDWH